MDQRPNNIRLDTIKLLEENIGRTLFDISHRKIVFSPPSRVMKTNKWDIIKFKSLHTAKEIIKKINRQPTEWEKIFATGVNLQNTKTAHSVLCKREKTKQNKTIHKQPRQNVGRRSRHFSKEDVQMANKHVKICSTSLIIREMQIKIIMR